MTFHDENIFADKGNLGALEAHTLTPGVIDIPKPQWDGMREGMLCMSQQTFGDYKAAIEILCSYEKNVCDYNTQQALKNFFLRMDQIIDKGQK